MQKIAINGCYGGFSLSRAAVVRARKMTGNPKWGGQCIKGDVYDTGEVLDRDYGILDGVARDDPALIAVIEAMGAKANGECSNLRIIEIPDGTEWQVEEYDGNEWVAEKHETWR